MTASTSKSSAIDYQKSLAHYSPMNPSNDTNIILSDVLSINASNSTGEVGIVADIGTISALRGRPLATMTSIISQDEASGPHVSNLPMQLVAEQIYSALQKARPLAVKVGFVCDPQTIECLCPTPLPFSDITLPFAEAFVAFLRICT